MPGKRRRAPEPLAIAGNRTSIRCVCGHITVQHEKGAMRCFNCPPRGKERCSAFRPDDGGR